MDETIGYAKKGFLDYYDVAKFQLEIDCQEVLEELEKRKKDTKVALKQFEDNLELNESIYRKAMKNFNDFIKENTTLDNLSATELMQRFIQSTLYLRKKDIDPFLFGEDDGEESEEGVSDTIEQEEDGSSNVVGKNVVGLFFHANWYLSSNQVNFIKIKLLKNELTKDVQLFLDEVTYRNIL